MIKNKKNGLDSEDMVTSGTIYLLFRTIMLTGIAIYKYRLKSRPSLCIFATSDGNSFFKHSNDQR